MAGSIHEAESRTRCVAGDVNGAGGYNGRLRRSLYGFHVYGGVYKCAKVCCVLLTTFIGQDYL